jgi:hypothetical protein
VIAAAFFLNPEAGLVQVFFGRGFRDHHGIQIDDVLHQAVFRGDGGMGTKNTGNQADDKERDSGRRQVAWHFPPSMEFAEASKTSGLLGVLSGRGLPAARPQSLRRCGRGRAPFSSHKFGFTQITKTYFVTLSVYSLKNNTVSMLPFDLYYGMW